MSNSQNEILSGLSNSAFLAVIQPPDPFSSVIKATQQSAINSDTYALLGTKAAPVTATQFNTGVFSSGVGSVTPDLVVSSITSGSGTAGAANVAPTSLQLNLNSTTLKTTDTLSLNGGWVYDANGSSDISKVDFWVQRADGSFVDVADATSFSAYAYDNKWAGFNYSLGLSNLSLGAGTTTLWAKAYDKTGASTDWLTKSFSVAAIHFAPTSLQFNLNSTSLKNTDTLSINNAWVYDSNGATDLSRVDFRIKRADGTFLDVADATTFVANTSDNRWGGFNYNLSLNGLNLGAGNYSLWSIAYDKAGSASAVVEKAFTVTVPNVAPTSLQFNLNSTSLKNTDTLSINNAWVYDSNGATDLSRVDFRIKRADGTFLDVADATTFVANTSDNRWGGFNYNLSLNGLNLGAGNYSLWSIAYDKAGAASAVVEKAFTVVTGSNVAPTSLQFNLNSTSLKNTDTLSINNGWVYDSNGATDLSRVDFRIKRADGTFLDVADATTFVANTSDNRWGGFNYNLSLNGLNLGAGNYSLWSIAYDKAGSASAVVEKAFTVAKDNVSDWFDQNLKDVGIVAKTRSLAADGSLSRNDIISIFRDANDGNTIDANELTDFRTILTNSSRFAIQDYVKVLANKVANSDPANTRSGFGNLYAGSSSTQLENLIGKWFLGTDRPATSYSYKYASGSLFQNGISADDIVQNQLGDCYFLATLSSIAQEKPSYIQNLFIDNGDSTFTVRFFNNGVADYVTVDRYLPTTSSGFSIYAGWGGGSSSSSSNELWVALAEKAYAQLGESGWSRPSNTKNAYSSIEGGWMDYVIRQVTGLSTTSQSATAMTQSQLIDLVNSNKVLTVGFVYGAGYGVVNGHAYTITSYNASTGTFRLRNPWGTSHANITWSQLQSLKGIVQWSNA